MFVRGRSKKRSHVKKTEIKLKARLKFFGSGESESRVDF
jgi:hypothetical protein